MGEQIVNVSPAKIFARPTADLIWLGPSRREALSQLSGKHRVRILRGPRSSGKTVLLERLAADDPSDDVLRVHGTIHSGAGLLTQLLQAAGLDPWQLSEVEQRNLFQVFAGQRCAQRRRIVVCIDDAERLAGPAWAELERLLTVPSIPLHAHLAIDASFDAEPTLGALRCAPHTAEHRLRPLSDEDVDSYLDWRLQAHGLEDVFTATAIRLLNLASHGRFAGIDVLAQMALLLLRRRGTGRVDVRLMETATRELAARHRAGLGETDATRTTSPSGRLIATRDGGLLATHALGPRVLIGRSEHNDLCLPSPYLSRHHAVVVGTTDGHYVVDLNSVNGLLLNGHLVRRAVLRDGDLLGLGPFRIKVEIHDEAASAGNASPPGSSLDDTAVMPAQPNRAPAVRIVK